MIKALIFDCFGVLYTGPLFTNGGGSSNGMFNDNSFTVPVSPLLGISALEADQQFFHSSKRNEQLLKFIQELRKTYKIGLLSNVGGNTLDGFFSSEERQQLFDEVVLSGEVNLAKPDRAIFELICSRLGVKLDEAIMIDDMQATCDIVKTFGMQSVCYKDFEQLKAELTILIQ